MAKPESERAVTEEEPPYKRRSPLWQHEKKIRELIREGYSYRQILGRLGLTVGISRLAAFAREELGITSRTNGPKATEKPGHGPEQERAGQSEEGAKTKSTQTAPAKPAPPSISEAFAEEADPLADLMKFRKQK